MNLTFVVSPLVGSVIGYCTNWVAVKMLFKPLEEKRILGMKVPFTPGVIPRRRGKLAESIGDAVGEELLTPDAFHEILQGEDMKEKIQGFVNERIKSLKEEERNLQELLDLAVSNSDDREELKAEMKKMISTGIKGLLDKEEIMSVVKKELAQIDIERLEDYLASDEYQDFKNKLSTFLLSNLYRDSTKEGLLVFLNNRLERIKDNQKTVSDFLPDGMNENLSEWLSDQGPEFVEKLISFLDSETAKERINKKLDEALGSNSVMQMVGGFLDKEKIVNQFIDYIVKFLEEPESQKEIIAKLDEFLDSIFETEAAVIIDKFDDEDLIEVIDFILEKTATEEVVDKLFNSLEESVVDKLAKKDLTNNDKIITVIEELIEKVIESDFLSAKIESWVDQQLDKLSERPVRYYFNKLDAVTLQKVELGVVGSLEYIIENHLGRVLSTLDFKEMVIKKVNDFDILEVENLLLSVIETELNAITWFGAVLGLIMGLITPFISVLFS
ncbi:DUF445 family protein [Acetohalobium arabaticum]|uniref:DUF445 domain-containing protein n=1 Tax=Acetohalobium arabaticum (strain ATCC 49924 / DSM 5501 / Z-7288) TaxID=574087 RepID=D9QQN7_ACEAZ|nr:DUF445 family protein [Acetohalobium arabaticum]ADL12828.1 protein of unknown function DUF445 [Acetohalobium arabaticum DSM 5501]